MLWIIFCSQSGFSQPFGRQGNTRRKVDFLQDQLTKRDFTVSCHAAAPAQNISEPELVTICIDMHRYASICTLYDAIQNPSSCQQHCMVVHACLIVSQNILEFDKAAVKRFHLLGSQEKLGKMWFHCVILMFQGMHADLDQKDLCFDVFCTSTVGARCLVPTCTEIIRKLRVGIG
jgi:hypothetical protein